MNRQTIQTFGEAFNGKTPSKGEQRSSGHPILKIRDIDEVGRFRGVFESFVDEDFYKKHAKKKLKSGDTIILNAAHNADYVGSKNAFVTDELDGVIATGEWLIVRVNGANSKYVNHYLRSPSGRKSLKNCVKGIHLYPKDVERISVPIPSAAEQIRIALLLDKVESLIAQRKQHLKQLDDLLKSIFLEMFGDPVRNEMGWRKRSCSDIAEVITGHPFKSDLYTDDASQIRLCGGLIIYPQQIEWEKCNFWPEHLLPGLERYLLEVDDIVLAMDRPWISSGLKICTVDEQGQGALLVQRTARLRAVEVDQHFLYAHLKHSSFTRHCKPTETTVPHISIKDIQKFEVICPPILLQTKFAGVARKLELTKIFYHKSLADLEALYGSLSQQAFKGELDLMPVTAS